jgi:predicted lipid-binding transport protein (Tim44 family)
VATSYYKECKMKKWLTTALALALVAATVAPGASEAKRFGGGKSQGMQRSLPDRSTPSTPQTPPAQPAAPVQTPGVPATAGAAAAAPAAAAAKRSWLGPIAGLAAGLGIAALMSSMGFGEGFANIVMMALLAVAAVVLVRFLMRRFAGSAQRAPLATAGAGNASPPWAPVQRTAAPVPVTPAAPAGSEVSVTGAPLAPLAATAQAAPVQDHKLVLPESFDLPAFERIAKMIFIRLQAANDAGDLDDLRQFTTPEMFAASRLEMQERGAAEQHTDVERVEAEVIDFIKEPGRQIVSVRFHGLIREEKGVEASAFNEIWHLTKPDDDSRSWAIAGIQQPQ